MSLTFPKYLWVFESLECLLCKVVENDIRRHRVGSLQWEIAAGGTFQEMKARRIAAMEKTYVEELLTKHVGNVTHCSEEAGMARSAFQKLMQKHGVRSADFRA